MKKTVLILACLILVSGFTARWVFNFNIDRVNAKTNQEEIDELNKQIEQRKTKIQQLEKSIETYKKNIQQKQIETVSLQNQLSIIDNHIDRLQADIELTDEKIKNTILEISSLQLSIKDKEKIISRQKEIIAKIIREINQEQNLNYLEILLTNTSFADFYGQVQNMEDVYQDLGRTTKSLRLTKEELESKKSLSEKYRTEQENLKTKLLLQKQDYNDQSSYKNNLLVKTKQSEKTYQTMLANLKTQYQQTENEISSYESEVRKKLLAQEKIPTGDSSVSMSWPTPSHYITSYFHDPEYPYRNVFEHSGIDIAASHGTALRAASSGYVARAVRCSSASCYSYVLLVHTSNLSTLYGHMSSITVSADQFVNKGDIIGYSGGTPGTVGAGPFVTGPHLHFEVRLNGIPTNPLNYVSQ